MDQIEHPIDAVQIKEVNNANLYNIAATKLLDPYILCLCVDNFDHCKFCMFAQIFHYKKTFNLWRNSFVIDHLQIVIK